MHFQSIPKMTTTETPATRSHNIYNFGWSCHAHYYLKTLSLSARWPKKKCMFTVWQKWPCCNTRNPFWRSKTPYLYVDYYYAFSFSSTCAGVEKKLFEHWSNFGSFDRSIWISSVQESRNLQFRFFLLQICFTTNWKITRTRQRQMGTSFNRPPIVTQVT